MAVPIRVAHVMGKMVGGGLEAVVMNYYHHVDRERAQFDFLVRDDSESVPRGEIELFGGGYSLRLPISASSPTNMCSRSA